MQSTYILTLVNDREFYASVLVDDYTQCLQVATRLHDAHHAEDGLTISERLTTITEAADEIIEDNNYKLLDTL
jgi:hypothetical protein